MSWTTQKVTGRFPVNFAEQVDYESEKTLKDLLVHPKDKQDKEDITECIYKVPCANCDKTYVGETGRKFGVRLHEHKTEVESKTKRAYTLSLIHI